MTTKLILNPITVKEAKKEVYKKSISIWFISVIIWISIYYFVSIFMSQGGIFFEASLDTDLRIFFVIIISICLYPISLLRAYKVWIYEDATKIWSNPIKAIREIKEPIINEYIKISRPYAYFFEAINYRPSSQLIFESYIEKRNMFVNTVLESKNKIDNGNEAEFYSLDDRPMNLSELFTIIVLCILSVIFIKILIV